MQSNAKPVYAPKVVIDTRERNSTIITELEAANAEIEFKTLAVGDYVISDRVCIERKTVPDFESSMMSGRLFDQLRRLRDGYEFPIVIVEGARDGFRLGMNAINGAIASIYVDHGMPVLFSPTPEDTAALILSMARMEQRDNAHGPSLKGSARARTSSQFQEYVVGNLPGIGQKLARALLLHFKSIRALANASPEEIMEVDKIGEKKAKAIHYILSRTFDFPEAPGAQECAASQRLREE